jgi:hypothetical protein
LMLGWSPLTPGTIWWILFVEVISPAFISIRIFIVAVSLCRWSSWRSNQVSLPSLTPLPAIMAAAVDIISTARKRMWQPRKAQTPPHLQDYLYMK